MRVHHQPARKRRRLTINRTITRSVCLLVAMSLLCNSTPAGAQTVVSVSNDWRVSLYIWLETSGSISALQRLLAGEYFHNTNAPEKQSDRDAKVTRLRISPADVTAQVGEVVRFSAIAYSENGDTIGGVKFSWSATGDKKNRALISAAGEFAAPAPGQYKVSVSGAGQTAQIVVTVVESWPVPKDPRLNVKYFSTRNAPPRSEPQTDAAQRTNKRQPGSVFRKTSFHTLETSATTAAPVLPQGADQYGWNLVNYMTADDPGSQTGDPPGAPVDGGAGNGNFQIAAPVLELPGRGIDISLGLAYNSHLWHKVGTNITYDIDRGWPSAGWSLGFGKMADIGDGGSILIDPDGTRHGFNGTATGPASNSSFSGRTNDGSFIDYSCVRNNGVIIFGSATLPSGTQLLYGAAGDGAVYPTFIIDPNGNYINVTYRNNAGPQIDTITDTLGRVINFHYDANNLLTAITAPALNGAGTRTMVRLHYQQQLVNASFSGVTPLVRAPSTRWLLDAIYYPATSNGYWFNDADSFLTSYGTIKKVSERRGMTHSTSGLTDMGTMTAGTMTTEVVYDWQTTTNDAPTYSTETENWAYMDSSAAVTTYLINKNSTPRTTTVTLPNGLKIVQYSHNAPGQFNDGLVFKDETYDIDGTTLLTRNETNWVSGDYNSPRPSYTATTTRQGTTYVTSGTEFTYQAAPSFNQATEVRNYDYGYVNGGIGNTLLRKTVTQYENSTNYTNRHIFNLPKIITIYSGTGTRVSQVEYTYDGLTLQNTPNVVQHLAESDPYAPSVTQPGHYITQCTGCPPCSCVPVWIPPTTSNPYKPETDYRGNITQIKTYADAATLAQGTAVIETRNYDITGNMVKSTSACCEQTTFDFTTTTQYAYPEKTTRGSATDQFAQVVTSMAYDFNTGVINSTTDANNRTSQTFYFDSLRPQRIARPTGAHTDFVYDDSAMTATETTYLGSHPNDTGLANQTVKYLNGHGQVRQESALGAGGVLDYVDSTFDSMGRLAQKSAPYRTGDTKQWTTIAYDAVGHATRVTAPDGSVTESYYNERDFDTTDSYVPARPDAAVPNAPGDSVLMRDAWGRERWQRTDAQGRLIEVVEPNPAGTGSAATGGLATTYSYDTLGNLTGVVQGSQTRSFRYDSLSRLTAQKLAEAEATLDDSGTYVGSGAWSEVFNYDLRSNLTSRIDARGVKAVYNYNNDPLNRLQSISWDTSGFGDVGNPIVAAATVTYAYRTKTTGPQLLDVTQLSSISTANVSTLAYVYDSQSRITTNTLTLTSRTSYPFVTDYVYDELDRLKDLRYPAEYGNGSQPRKLVHQDYDVASRLSGLTVDSQAFASNIAYNAASQTTSVRVGAAGVNQIIESYDFSPATGLLNNQTIARDSAPSNFLLDLTYDYTNANGKRTGQITKILNNKNHNKDRTYTYDAVGRLTQAKGGVAGALWTETYGYDRYGNRTTVTATGTTARLGSSTSDNVAANRGTSAPTVTAPTTESPVAKLSDQLAANSSVELPDSLRTDLPRSISDSSLNLGARPLTPQGPPVFTDDPIVAGVTVIKAIHITELRTAVNQARARANLAAATWAEAVSAGVLVKASHILELRAKLDDARIALGMGAATYTGPAPTVGGPINALHIQELRQRVTEALSSLPISLDGHASLSFSASSNRINTTGWEYDKAGNQTRIMLNGGAWQRFQYDAANRLVNVKTDAQAVIATYTYGDTKERLMVEASGSRTYYTCEGNAEYTESGGSTTPLWSLTYFYLGARLLSKLSPNGAGGELVEYYHPDHLGTRLVTNAQDTTSFEQVTLPFGTALSEATGATNRRFNSYDRSLITKLDYAVNRHYDPQQGRFTQVDPVGMSSVSLDNPQTLNLYAYCAGDPINHSDPSGLGFLSFLKKIFKGIGKILSNKWVLLVVGIVVGIAAGFAFYWAIKEVGGAMFGAFIAAGIVLAGTSAALIVAAFHPRVQLAFQIAGVIVSGFQSFQDLLRLIRGPSPEDLLNFVTPWNPDAAMGFQAKKGSGRRKMNSDERQKAVCWNGNTWPIRYAAMRKIASKLGGVYNKTDSEIHNTGSYNDVLKRLDKAGFQYFINLNPKHFGGPDYQGVINGNWYHVTVYRPYTTYGSGIFSISVFDPDKAPPKITVHCEAGKPSYIFHP